ncbi:hypothetical protein AC739_18860 [Planococcus glaciei]|nr:hypothetical protein AC739_18860 [Planococcus glaciei]
MMDWQWPEVDALESQEKWNEAKSFLLKNWQQDPTDVKVTIRLGFFCWYLLVEEVPLGVGNVDLDELATILIQATNFGLANLKDHEEFLWIFGYMISLFPYYFGDYEDWEEKGKLMLRRTHELCPDEPVYQYSYISSLTSDDVELKNGFQQLKTVLEDRFQGKGLLSEYFTSIWQNWQGI